MTLSIGPDNRTIIKKLVPNATFTAPGTWSKSSHGAVMVTCPKCGKTGTIRYPLGVPFKPDQSPDHEILPDGAVVPSLVCPNTRCDWHVYARLDDWKG